MQNRKCTFDGETLFSDEEVVATYSFTRGIIGVGESLTLNDPTGEHLFALRSGGGGWFSNRLYISNRDTVFAEITYSFFGMRFRVSVHEELPAEIVLLCLWVAMTKLVGS